MSGSCGFGAGAGTGSGAARTVVEDRRAREARTREKRMVSWYEIEVGLVGEYS